MPVDINKITAEQINEIYDIINGYLDAIDNTLTGEIEDQLKVAYEKLKMYNILLPIKEEREDTLSLQIYGNILLDEGYTVICDSKKTVTNVIVTEHNETTEYVVEPFKTRKRGLMLVSFKLIDGIKTCMLSEFSNVVEEGVDPVYVYKDDVTNLVHVKEDVKHYDSYVNVVYNMNHKLIIKLLADKELYVDEEGNSISNDEVVILKFDLLSNEVTHKIRYTMDLCNVFDVSMLNILSEDIELQLNIKVVGWDDVGFKTEIDLPDNGLVSISNVSLSTTKDINVLHLSRPEFVIKNEDDTFPTAIAGTKLSPTYLTPSLLDSQDVNVLNTQQMKIGVNINDTTTDTHLYRTDDSFNILFHSDVDFGNSNNDITNKISISKTGTMSTLYQSIVPKIANFPLGKYLLSHYFTGDLNDHTLKNVLNTITDKVTKVKASAILNTSSFINTYTNINNNYRRLSSLLISDIDRDTFNDDGQYPILNKKDGRALFIHKEDGTTEEDKSIQANNDSPKIEGETTLNFLSPHGETVKVDGDLLIQSTKLTEVTSMGEIQFGFDYENNTPVYISGKFKPKPLFSKPIVDKQLDIIGDRNITKKDKEVIKEVIENGSILGKTMLRGRTMTTMDSDVMSYGIKQVLLMSDTLFILTFAGDVLMFNGSTFIKRNISGRVVKLIEGYSSLPSEVNEKALLYFKNDGLLYADGKVHGEGLGFTDNDEDGLKTVVDTVVTQLGSETVTNLNLDHYVDLKYIYTSLLKHTVAIFEKSKITEVIDSTHTKEIITDEVFFIKREEDFSTIKKERNIHPSARRHVVRWSKGNNDYTTTPMSTFIANNVVNINDPETPLPHYHDHARIGSTINSRLLGNDIYAEPFKGNANQYGLIYESSAIDANIDDEELLSIEGQWSNLKWRDHGFVRDVIEDNGKAKLLLTLDKGITLAELGKDSEKVILPNGKDVIDSHMDSNVLVLVDEDGGLYGYQLTKRKGESTTSLLQNILIEGKYRQIKLPSHDSSLYSEPIRTFDEL